MPDVPNEVKFRSAYEAHARTLLGYALRRTATPADAADVVAETMLTAWRRLDIVPVEPETILWLYGVARNVIANGDRTQRHNCDSPRNFAPNWTRFSKTFRCRTRLWPPKWLGRWRP